MWEQRAPGSAGGEAEYGSVCGGPRGTHEFVYLKREMDLSHMYVYMNIIKGYVTHHDFS